jgi:predicted Na+-dependent transporter
MYSLPIPVMPLGGFIAGYIMLRPYELSWLGGQVLTGTCPTGVVSGCGNISSLSYAQPHH